jgi:hypothetical protein
MPPAFPGERKRDANSRGRVGRTVEVRSEMAETPPARLADSL